MPRKNPEQTGMIAGAHPTAPGGMSKPALIEELQSGSLFTDIEIADMNWPRLIDAVIEQRLLTEQEAALAATALFIGMPDSRDYIFDGHAGASPSGAERWMACTASLEATREFLETLSPNQQAQVAKSGIAASQGTTAHAAAEAEALVILGRQTVEEAEAVLLELAVLPDSAGEAYDDEMAEYITEYVDLVRGYAHERGDDAILIEETVEAVVELTYADEDGEDIYHAIRGSADLIALPTAEQPTLVVGDLKYGEGIEVDVDENPQVRIYALGALAMLTDDEGVMPPNLEDITYHIVQPRLGGIKTWTESVDDLLDWRDEALAPALSAALLGINEDPEISATFTPGEVQCQFCPVRGSCAALTEQRVEMAAGLFDAIVEGEFSGEGFPETALLTDERLGDLYTQALGLVKLAAEMKEELQRRMHRGHAVPGFKLVNYTPPRKWKAEALEELDPGNKAEGILPEEQAALLWKEPTLVTPTAAEKLLGDAYAQIEALVEKPDKRPVVAPVTDRRSTWEGKPPESMFDIEDGAEEA